MPWIFMRWRFSYQKGILLFIIFISYTHACLAQKKDFQLVDYVRHRSDQPLEKEDYIIVDEKGLRNLNVVFKKNLGDGYFVVKPAEADKVSLRPPYLVANALWKLSPTVSRMRTQKVVPDLSGHQQFILGSFDLPSLRAFLHAADIPIVRMDQNSFIVRLSNPSLLKKLIECELVTFVDVTRAIPVEETLNTLQDLSVNAINYVHHHYETIDGRSMNVSVRERAPEKGDIDLMERILESPLEDQVISFHANQMATIIAGGGNSSEDSKGIAPLAKVSSASFNSALPDPLEYFRDYDISVQNHSYGYEIENYYGFEAQAFDIQTNENLQLVHVFSSGNKGIESATNGKYSGLPGFANMTGNMKMSKNIIVAGGHYEDFSLDERNSRGPAYDGRLKPDIVAYGPEGTSDAAAYTSGVATLLQEQYKIENGALPSSAMVRMLLAASADDVAAEGIDFQSGFGALNARRAMDWLRSGQFFHGTVAADAYEEYEFDVPEGIEQIRVALAWNDPAAPPGSAIALVNDLDLEVITPDQTIYLPWVLNSFPHADSLTAPQKRKKDRLNNTEYITIATPTSGRYVVKVLGFKVEDDQPYSCGYWLDTARVFSWTFPVASDRRESDKDTFLRWNTTYQGAAQLSVSINGDDFRVVDGNTALDRRMKLWRTPGEASFVNFKMTISGEEFVSDTLLVSPIPDYDVGFNCAEEGMLQWNQVAGAEGYKVFNLDGGKMVPVAERSETDTSYFFNSSEVSPYFALAATYNGKTGKRSLTYDFRNKGAACYYRLFFATSDTQGNAVLNLELSTRYNISGISFQKKEGLEFITIGEQAPAEDVNYEFFDEGAGTGIFIYRAVIHLSDGSEVITNEARLILANENTFAVFPNPVIRGIGDLNILSDGDRLSLELLNVNGQVVVSHQIFGTVFHVDVSDLPPGIYFYRFIRDSDIAANGKIIVR
jgi:hypothetical protein